jgi:cell division protein FtsQ
LAEQVVFEGRWAERKKARSGRFIYFILGIIAAVIAGELAFQFLIAPNMKVDKIVFDSNVPLRREELLAAAGLNGTLFYFKIDIEAVQKGLEALPAVKSASVEKSFPGSLRIVARGREPVAVAYAETETGMLPLAFDEDGVIFLAGANVPETNLPVLSGLRFENPGLGTRLPPMLKPFLQDILNLRKGSPALFAAFSEMRVVPRGAEHFEILLYPEYYRAPLRIEGELDAERCKMFLIVLDALLRDGTLDTLAEIDCRTGDMVYRLKES